MLSFSTKLACSKLVNKLSISKLQAIIDEKNITSTNTVPSEPSNIVRIATTSVALKPYNNIEDFIEHIEYFVKEACSNNADIVCFPQFTGVLPLSVLPVFDEIIHIIYSDKKVTREQDIINITEIFDIVGAPLFEFYYNLFYLLSSRYKIYIHAGTTIVPTKNGLFNTAFIFDPFGRCICEQNKINPSKIEDEFNLCSGNMLDVFQITYGTIATIIGSDQYYYDCFKIGRNLGAKIVFVPCGPCFNMNNFKALRGAPVFVEKNECFAVKSCLVGTAGGITFGDRSGIFGPFYACGDKDYICISENFSKDEVLIGDIDTSALINMAEVYTSDKNTALYEKYYERYKPQTFKEHSNV